MVRRLCLLKYPTKDYKGIVVKETILPDIFVDEVNSSNQKINELPVRNAAIELQILWFEDVVNAENNGYYYVSGRYKDITSIRLWNINDKSVISKACTEHLGHWMRDKIGVGKGNTRTVISQNKVDRW